MRRFFAEIEEGKVILTGEDAHHIADVLRLAPGEQIIACTGDGTDHVTELTLVSGRQAEGRILRSVPSRGEPDVQITVFQGLPKGDKLELIIQKAVELGAAAIVPVETRRSVAKVEEKKKQAKCARWNKIAEAAAKQSGRGRIPVVHPPVSFAEALEWMQQCNLPLAAYEEETTQTLKQVLESNNRPRTVGVFIGPEGGIDPDEAARLRKADIPTITLGSRILRCETAPIALLSMLLYHYGEEA